MTKKARTKHKNLLTSPGTLTYVGPEIGLRTLVRCITFNRSFLKVTNLSSIAEACEPATNTDNPANCWLDVTGIHEADVVGQIGNKYHLHPLLLEDVMNTNQKPKVEDYDDEKLFITLKMLHFDESDIPQITPEHVSFVLDNGLLISFQEERKGNIFTPVSDRLSASVGKTRSYGVDYLLFALLDVVIDNYFVVIEKLGEQLEAQEDIVIAGYQSRSLNDLYTLKRELTYVRRAIWPLRDMLSQLLRDDHPLITKEVLPYLRDLSDHVMQAIETIDSYRELVASLVDVHLSTLSNRMNEVMKTLTIFSAIFMPITFIVGVYGMNFHYMPELEARNGYYYTWGVMVAVTVGMLGYFKWKRWM